MIAEQNPLQGLHTLKSSYFLVNVVLLDEMAVFFIRNESAVAGHCCPGSRPGLSHKLGQEIDGQRENDGRILLGRDGAQSLCVSQNGRGECGTPE